MFITTFLLLAALVHVRTYILLHVVVDWFRSPKHCTVCTSFLHVVSGEANFTMHYNGLTVGGFTPPSAARNIFEHQANVYRERPLTTLSVASPKAYQHSL